MMDEKQIEFYPTIGWPGGRGAYDRLLKNFKRFKKIDVNQFLFNFSSFLFGFSVPKKDDFGSRWKTGEFKKDIRKIILTKIEKENRSIENFSQNMVSEELKEFIRNSDILLDVGGNRIFNKLNDEDLDLTKLESYEKYFQEYIDFVKISNPDIYVNFDIGPSYTSRVDISKNGRKAYSNMTDEEKMSIYQDLTERTIQAKDEIDSKLMIPISAAAKDHFEEMLQYVYDEFKNEADFIGIAGIAQKGRDHTSKVLGLADDFVTENEWDVDIHGLGLGGISNIPMDIKYGLKSYDVATPWRRACTDKTSQIYTPLLGGDLEFLDNKKPFKKVEITSDIIEEIECTCPICKETPPTWMKKKFLNGSKHHSDNAKHGEKFYNAQIKIYFHNVYQHVALTKKLEKYKKDYGEGFLSVFLDDLPEGEGRSFSNFCNSIQCVS